LDYYLCL